MDNVAQWLSTLVPAAIAVLTIVINAVVNTKIKFAPDAATASRDLRRSALRIAQWILNALVLLFLIQDLLSAEPLTRLVVLKIALEVTVLAFVLTASLFHSTISLIARLNTIISALADGHRELSDKQREILDSQGGGSPETRRQRAKKER